MQVSDTFILQLCLLYILNLLEDRAQADTVLQIINSSKTDSISIQFSLK